MLRESVQSWTQQETWPLLDNNNSTMDTNLFDSNAFLNADQVLQLQDLFGQDEHAFDRDASLLYDEFTFVPDMNPNMVDTIEPSDLINSNYVDNIVTEAPMMKRRRSSCSSASTYSSSSSSSSENDEEDFSSINNSSNRRSSMSSDSSDSEAEQEVVITPYLHRRQMEEMILDKITNHLEPEKLPGILTIISKAHEEEVEEVEIDLARLDRDQLERILSYVNDCLVEKNGGPKVKLSNYTVQPVMKPTPVAAKQQQETFVTTQPKKTNTNRQRRNNRRKSIIEEGHVVNGSLTSKLSATHGPISMSALTEIESKSSKSNKKKRRAKKNKKDEDNSVHMPTHNLNPLKESIASTKPKRKSAIHKRRLLEEMLQPSNEDSSDDEDDDEEENSSGIIVFGNEQMDMAVTHNETIIHQEQTSCISDEEEVAIILPTAKLIEEEQVVDDDDDELIDIMI